MSVQEKQNILVKRKPFSIQEEKELYQDLQNIEDSTSGRGDLYAIGGNIFIQESVQLLKNAIILYQSGFFDCAYYSIREAIEIATVFIFLSDIPRDDRDQWFSAWKSNLYFPEQNKMMNQLAHKGDVFTDMKKNMASFFNHIDEVNKRINKYVHKQGFQHFYIERNRQNNTSEQDEVDKTDFLYFLKTGISTAAVMRLAIDPFPILLMDEEILFRCFDSWTEPYSRTFVDKYIGQNTIEDYKKTEIFQAYYSRFINEPKKNTPTFRIMHDQFIDTMQEKEIISQLPLLDFQDYSAARIAFCCNKVNRISCASGLHEYITDRAKPRREWSWICGQFDSFEKNPNHYNQPYKDGFISVIPVFDENFFIEHENDLITL